MVFGRRIRLRQKGKPRLEKGPKAMVPPPSTTALEQALSDAMGGVAKLKTAQDKVDAVRAVEKVRLEIARSKDENNTMLAAIARDAAQGRELAEIATRCEAVKARCSRLIEVLEGARMSLRARGCRGIALRWKMRLEAAESWDAADEAVWADLIESEEGWADLIARETSRGDRE